MIPFNQLSPLHDSIREEIDRAVKRTVDSGWYILGPEVAAFEAEFAAYHGVSHCVAVANGTDAIEIALRAGGVGPGDEVVTVSHTAVATVCAIQRTGADVVLVDIEPESFTIDPAAFRAAITPRTRAVVPVHLYGHPADMTQIVALASQHGLLVIEDCAQAHGARHRNRIVGAFGQLAAFSFYPTKNLGALGDGGAILTDDAQLAERLRQLRNYGQTSRYLSAISGFNSRLDEIQAAVLRVKLAHLDDHNAARRRLAKAYGSRLHGVTLPSTRIDDTHAYHLYVVRHPDRNELQRALQAAEIATLIHYPIPVHLQPAFADLGYERGALPNTEEAADQILSLPLFIGLSIDQIDSINSAVQEFVGVSHALR